MSVDRESIKKYLESAFGLDASEVDDDTPLFTSGLLDSFSVADLLMYLEDNGGFTIEPHEIVPENLDSLDRILKFAATKAD